MCFGKTKKGKKETREKMKLRKNSRGKKEENKS